MSETEEVKQRAIEVTLSDGKTKIFVHEPQVSDLPFYLSAVPAMPVLFRALRSAGNKDGANIIGLMSELSDATMASVYPLLSSMTGTTIDGFKKLSVWDGIAILNAFVELLPKNPIRPVETLESTPKA